MSRNTVKLPSEAKKQLAEIEVRFNEQVMVLADDVTKILSGGGEALVMPLMSRWLEKVIHGAVLDEIEAMIEKRDKTGNDTEVSRNNREDRRPSAKRTASPIQQVPYKAVKRSARPTAKDMDPIFLSLKTVASEASPARGSMHMKP